MISENVKKVVETLSDSLSSLATVFILAGIIFLFLGFLRVDGTQIISRDTPYPLPVILGAVISIVGLLLFFLEYTSGTKKRAKTVVFYSPTIKANSFFVELLDFSVELAKQKDYNFIIEKGNLEQYHAATNYLEVIRKYSGKRASNTVLIMIPPSPNAYKHIWSDCKDLDVNLITLDLDTDLEGQENKFLSCSFHKGVILVDNQLGASLAAQEIVSYCHSEQIKAINIIICEGDFHARGQLFKNEIEKLSRGSLELCFLGRFEKLPFSDAVKHARNYISNVIRNASEDLKTRPTFVFCANDNMAIGARMEVSHFPFNTEDGFKPLHIICFDASTFVKLHIELGDKYLWCAIDQRYTEIVRRAFESAERLLEGKSLEERVIRVRPDVHKQFRLTV